MAYWGVVLLTCLATEITIRFRQKHLIAILPALFAYFPFLIEFRHSTVRGFMVLLLWVVTQSVLVLFHSYRNPSQMGDLIWKGREYSESMFRWLDTRRLPEEGPFSVMLSHAKQALLYCASALVSANFLSMVLGSALLNYMNYYVAMLARQSRNKWIAFLLGWNPWSLIRVVSFLWLGVVLTLPLLRYLLPLTDSFSCRMLIAGLTGVFLDICLKLCLSAYWSGLLKRNLAIRREGLG